MEVKPTIKPKVETLDITIPQPAAVQGLSSVFEDYPFPFTTSEIPDGSPTHWSRAVQIYINGATKRLYTYDKINSTWVYVALPS